MSRDTVAAMCVTITWLIALALSPTIAHYLTMHLGAINNWATGVPAEAFTEFHGPAKLISVLGTIFWIGGFFNQRHHTVGRCS
jgi:hypothetical protein